ncbi:PAS domain S-box protein [Persephonella atlantica]|uniref:PAS domain S-box protein n=1 Tax=Persephonella atlantica TaxID=2699429 RepID=A0ABS1GFU3_9AQUI|nr:PAS domain S-box protein [Persephonella atlantica]MBK3331785.1 PAS domain S-box protein [Persephonella atlantica]
MFRLFLGSIVFITVIIINVYMYGLGKINYAQVIPNIIFGLIAVLFFSLSEKLKNLPTVYNKLNAGLLLIILSQANLSSFFITGQPLYLLILSEIFIKLPGLILVLMGFHSWIKVKEKREKILEEQEEKWKTIVEGVNDIIVIIQDNKIKYANSKVKDFLGYRPEEISGKDIENFISPKELKNIFSSLVKKNSYIQHNLKIRSKDGKERVFELNPSLISYESKSALLCILRDITLNFEKENELIKAKEKLEELKGKLYEAQKLANVGYWEVHLPERRFYISDEALKIICGAKKECIKTFEDFNRIITTEYRDKIRIKRNTALKELKPYETEYTINIDGGEKIIREKVKIIEDANRNKILLGIIQDITNIHNMYQKVLENEERYRNLFEYSNDAILITDLEGRILDANQKAVYKTGHTKTDLLFLNIREIFGEKFSKVYPQWLKKIYINRFVRFETDVITENRSQFPAEVSASIFEIKENKYIQLIVRDITERKLTEKELKLASIVFDNALEGIVITDDRGNILRTNTGLSQITGFDKHELLNWHITEFPVFKSKNNDIYIVWDSAKKEGKWQGEMFCTKRSGETFPALVSIIQVKNKREITNYIVMISDITKRKHREMKLKNLAYYDNLTKLPNRVHFFSRLKSSIQKAYEDNTKVALFFIDLDGFKNVNDTYGHEYGDRLLVGVAHRLKMSVRKDDFVARLAGDEFVILIEGVSDREVLNKISEKIINNVGKPYKMGNKEINIGASIGISILPDDAKDIETFLKHADFAMYHSKLTGKNRYTFYSDISDKRA